jgi:Spy/CpxP family protein refolding chaperone
MNAVRSCLVLLLVLVGGLARAEPPPRGDDPIAARLFPPELIMSHQRELGIDDKQRAAILKEVQKTQAALLPLQWQMQGLAADLGKLLDEPKIDEAKVLAQADKVMDLERQIKKQHLGLLVRLRNQLTDAQRKKAHELRQAP